MLSEANFGFTDLDWATIFAETNQFIEKASKIGFFVVMQISLPGLVLPKALFCYFQYFTTDLANGAFELSLPMW